MKIIYITNSRIPTTKAQGFQIMKMCEAFSSAGGEVELWVPRRFNPIKESPFRYYEIREIFSIKKIAVFDPEAAAEAKKTFGTSIQYCKTDYDALKGADSLFLMTEWMEFRNPDFEKMAALMNHQVIFDGRNIYDKEKLLQNGWFYEGIGIGQSDFI